LKKTVITKIVIYIYNKKQTEVILANGIKMYMSNTFISCTFYRLWINRT